jgi:branched-chain amino acid transport system substrate-binding protein
MKKSLLIAIIACLGLLLLSSSAGLAKELAPYVVGFSCDLSGLRAEIGIPTKWGSQMVLNQINAAGGINGRLLQAVFYDHAGNEAQGVKNTKRLIEVDKAVAVLGYEGVSITFASLTTATEAKTLLFTGGPAIVSGAPAKKWLFGVVPDQKIASIPILIKNLLARGCRKIAYIYTDTAYGSLGLKAVDASCKKLGITPTIIEKYAPDTIEFSPQLSHIKASGADGLLITGNVPDTVKVIKAARELGIQYPIVCDYAIVGPEFIELGRKIVEGVVSTSLKTLVAPDLPNTDVQKKVAMEVYNAYTKEKQRIDLYVGHGWDLAQLIVKVLKNVDSNLDPTKDTDLTKIREQLRDSLENVKGFVGQNGIFNYSPTDHVGLSEGCYVPVMVKNGKWVLQTH